MRCHQCGYETDDRSAFCTNCGAPVKKDPPAPNNDPFANNQNPNQQYPPPGQYGQPPYNNGQQPYNQQQPPYNNNQPPYQANEGNKHAKTALTCGIISLFCFGFILGIIALVYGIKAYKELKAVNMPTTTAVVGIILGIIGIVGWGFGIIFMPFIW